jgi:hypothetical protein
MRVSRPGDEPSVIAARRAALRVFVLRAAKGSPPVIGTDDASALQLIREEIESANEIWLQCNITFGAPSEAPIEIVDPPEYGFIAVANRDGLPARGGAIQLRADGKMRPPIMVPPGSPPADPALRTAAALRAHGLSPLVTINPRTAFGAASSADIVVRRRNGELALIDAAPGFPLSTDPQQRIELGVVDLGDGVEEFDNMTATSGTLEERMLIKTLADEDPSTIDLFVINRFTHGTRQGEAFIEASAGAIGNAVILDRTGLRSRETAWTMAHEIGHVLLNQPLHPDNVGRDRPWLLMDSDNNRGTVNGPKRLTPQECSQARDVAGTPVDLLKPYAERSAKAPKSSAPSASSRRLQATISMPLRSAANSCSALPWGRTTRLKPSFFASLTREPGRGTARSSPVRPTSPNASTLGCSARSRSAETIAAHSARSTAGSSTRRPPATLANTS